MLSLASQSPPPLLPLCYVPLSASVSVYVCLSLSLSVLDLCLYLYPSASICLCLSICIESLSLSVSVFLSQSLCLCLSLSLSLSVSVLICLYLSLGFLLCLSLRLIHDRLSISLPVDFLHLLYSLVHSWGLRAPLLHAVSAACRYSSSSSSSPTMQLHCMQMLQYLKIKRTLVLRLQSQLGILRQERTTLLAT